MDCLERIRFLLKERGWSVYKLAQTAEIPQSTLANLFMRNNVPTIPTLERICEALGITLAEFFSEDGTVSSEERLDRSMKEKWNRLALIDKQLVLELIDRLS